VVLDESELETESLLDEDELDAELLDEESLGRFQWSGNGWIMTM